MKSCFSERFCGFLTQGEEGKALLSLLIILPLFLLLLFGFGTGLPGAASLGLETSDEIDPDLVLDALFDSPSMRPYRLGPRGIVENSDSFDKTNDASGTLPLALINHLADTMNSRDNVDGVLVAVHQFSIEYKEKVFGKRAAVTTALASSSKELDEQERTQPYFCERAVLNMAGGNDYATRGTLTLTPGGALRATFDACNALMQRNQVVPCVAMDDVGEIVCVGVVLDRDVGLFRNESTARAFVVPPVQQYIDYQTSTMATTTGGTVTLQRD